MGSDVVTTRERILRAAAALFREQGFTRASMRDLADRVGIHKSSLYHHFPSKQALLLEILETTVDRSAPVLAAIAGSGQPASERLRRAVANHVTELIRDQDNVACFLEEGRYLDRRYMDIYISKRDQYEGHFRRIIGDGVRRGEFRPVNVRLASLAILGMCNGMAKWWRPDGEFGPREIAVWFAEMAVQSVTASPGVSSIPAGAAVLAAPTVPALPADTSVPAAPAGPALNGPALPGPGA